MGASSTFCLELWSGLTAFQGREAKDGMPVLIQLLGSMEGILLRMVNTCDGNLADYSEELAALAAVSENLQCRGKLAEMVSLLQENLAQGRKRQLRKLTRTLLNLIRQSIDVLTHESV